jgi:hypothetical protein
MQMNEWNSLHQLVDPAFGLGARHEEHLALVQAGLHADAAQGVEVELDLVAPSAAHQRVEMREAPRPERAAIRHHGRDAVARAEQAREPGAARMLGEVHEKAVAPRSQALEEMPFKTEA